MHLSDGSQRARALVKADTGLTELCSILGGDSDEDGYCDFIDNFETLRSRSEMEEPGLTRSTDNVFVDWKLGVC